MWLLSDYSRSGGYNHGRGHREYQGRDRGLLGAIREVYEPPQIYFISYVLKREGIFG